MTKKYKVYTRAVFNGQPVGSTIEVDEDFARKYEAMKYLDIVEEVKPKAKPKKKTQAKKASAPKKPTKKTTAKKSDKKE